MTVKVVNKYKEPNHIYCGRGTPVGNPFVMSDKSDKERDRVCDAYGEWFEKEISKKWSPITDFVNNLVFSAIKGDINLGCFCAPKRCHCETIKSYIDKSLEERQ